MTGRLHKKLDAPKSDFERLRFDRVEEIWPFLPSQPKQPEHRRSQNQSAITCECYHEN